MASLGWWQFGVKSWLTDAGVFWRGRMICGVRMARRLPFGGRWWFAVGYAVIVFCPQARDGCVRWVWGVHNWLAVCEQKEWWEFCVWACNVWLVREPQGKNAPPSMCINQPQTPCTNVQQMSVSTGVPSRHRRLKFACEYVCGSLIVQTTWNALVQLQKFSRSMHLNVSRRGYVSAGDCTYFSMHHDEHFSEHFGWVRVWKTRKRHVNEPRKFTLENVHFNNLPWKVLIQNSKLANI